MLYVYLGHYLAIALNWAVLIGVPFAYVAASVYFGRRIAGKAGRITTWVLILGPIVWLAATYLSFWRLCVSPNKLIYHYRDSGVKGVMAVGHLAQDSLRADVVTEDGYLFYEYELNGQLHRVDPSGRSESVRQPRSRYAFEVSEPRSHIAILYLHESKLEIRDVQASRVVAEGTDILVGGDLLDRLHNTFYRAKYLACGPGLDIGGWRRGITKGQRRDSRAQYIKRDRELVRTALIPSRSAATLEASLSDPARAKSLMSFQQTLWKLVSAIVQHGSYNEPTLFFRGEVPVSHLYPATAAQVSIRAHEAPIGEPDPKLDPEVARAKYWVDVLYSPKQHGRDLTTPRIRVIQQPKAVVVKGVPIPNRNEVLGTETLDFRRRLQEDMNQLIRTAVQSPSPYRSAVTTLNESVYGFEETTRRLLDAISATREYRLLRHWSLPASSINAAHLRPGDKVMRIEFARKDGRLMAEVFSYDSHAYRTTPLYLDLIERGGVVLVDISSIPGLLPRGLPQDTVAEYTAEVADLLAKAIGSK